MRSSRSIVVTCNAAMLFVSIRLQQCICSEYTYTLASIHMAIASKWTQAGQAHCAVPSTALRNEGTCLEILDLFLNISAPDQNYEWTESLTGETCQKAIVLLWSLKPSTSFDAPRLSHECVCFIDQLCE